MKPTLEISDNLFRRAKKLGEREGKTFEEVIEAAIEAASITCLEACERAAMTYVLQIPVVSSEIALEFLNVPWEKVRDELYAYPFTNSALVVDSIQPVKTATRCVTSPKAQKAMRVVRVVNVGKAVVAMKGITPQSLCACAIATLWFTLLAPNTLFTSKHIRL